MKNIGCPISKEICLQTFHQDFKQESLIECLLQSTNTIGVGSDINLMTKDEEIHKNIIQNCSLNNLSWQSDKCLWEEIKIVKPRSCNMLPQFRSFQNFQRTFQEDMVTSHFMYMTHRKTTITKDLSYNNSRDIGKPQEVVKNSPALILDEMLVTVLVYKPIVNYNPDFNTHNQIKWLKPEIRIDLLGSQTLEELMKTISCKNDTSLVGDFSNVMPTWKDHQNMAKDLYKGSFIFIENVFYDSEEGEDISTPIINWVSRDKGRLLEFGSLIKRSMNDTMLKDLKICIGKPYLYQHLGDCEHNFVFIDLKMINKHHCQDPSKYPIITGKCKYKPVKCLLCETAGCDWIVMNCNITPNEKTPLCEYCLRMFLYDENYQKIPEAGDFQVYKFPSFN